MVSVSFALTASRRTDMADITPEAGLFLKIAQVMAEIGRVEKKGYNDFHKYKYVTEADLVEAVRAKLADRNVALIPGVVSVDGREYTTDRGKNSVVTTVVMSFTFVDGDTGAMFRSEWAGQGDDPADKGLYKAYTGALKYFLMKTFLIPTGDDPEADKSTDERSSSRQPYTSQTIPASEAQKKMIRGMVTKHHPSVEQLNHMLRVVEAGFTAEAGWVDRLTGGRDGSASALISWFKERPLPDVEHSTDVPVDDAGFVHPPAVGDVPWEVAS